MTGPRANAGAAPPVGLLLGGGRPLTSAFKDLLHAASGQREFAQRCLLDLDSVREEERND